MRNMTPKQLTTLISLLEKYDDHRFVYSYESDDYWTVINLIKEVKCDLDKLTNKI